MRQAGAGAQRAVTASACQYRVTNPRRMRELNIGAVLRYIVRHGPVARAELAQRLTLSPATASRLVGDLIAAGFVREVGSAPSRGGRRRRLVAYNPESGSVLGVDIGGTKVALVLIDLGGRERASARYSTLSAQGNVLVRVGDYIEEFLARQNVPRERLLACGVAAPGVVDQDGVVSLAPNLGWTGVAVRSPLQERLGVPVLVDNDCNLAALAESRVRFERDGQATRNLLFVAPGTGLGAGIVLEGQLYRGSRFMAGEIGYSMLGPEYLDGDYQGHGCLEWFTSGEAAARIASAILETGAAQVTGPSGKAPSTPAYVTTDTSTGPVSTADGPLGASLSTATRPAAEPGCASESGLAEHPSPSQLTAALVYEAAQNGALWALEAVDRIARYLGVALGNMACLLDPDRIVLGGGILRVASLMLPRIEAVMARFVPRPIPVETSLLGEWAQAMGAAYLALEHVLNTLFDVTPGSERGV